MLTITKKEIDHLLLTSTEQEIISVNIEVNLFENRYRCSFGEFEKKMQLSEKENFSEWDDYIEWKAEVKHLEFLQLKKREIEQGHYTIT